MGGGKNGEGSHSIRVFCGQLPGKEAAPVMADADGKADIPNESANPSTSDARWATS